MRKLRNKGAIVVLIINFLVVSIFYYLNEFDSAADNRTTYIYITRGLAISLLGCDV